VDKILIFAVLKQRILQQRETEASFVYIIIIIIIINRFVWRHKVVTSDALGPGCMLVSRERRESLGKEECL